MNYGEYFGLDARNAYVATASLGNQGGRAPMNAVYRTAGLAKPIGGTTPQVLVLTTTGTMAGEVSLSPLPAPYTGSETGTYAQERGGTAYEFTNHLGNVLAVVSDKKLGQGGTTATPIATYYHPETRMLTDYYPFGMAMVGRTWQSGEYRYGFNGMQKDNEIVGEANGYDFGARLYDGRVGRWWSVDPMAGEFASYSPFSGFENNPINNIDLDGRENYFYLVFLNSKESKLKITRETQLRIAAGIQAILNLNCMNMRVKLLESNGMVAHDKIDKSDALVYFGAGSDFDLSTWTHFNDPQVYGMELSGKKVGAVRLDIVLKGLKDIVPGGFAPSRTGYQDKGLEGQRQSHIRNGTTFSNPGERFEMPIWVGLIAIHEAIGHGILGASHTNEYSLAFGRSPLKKLAGDPIGDDIGRNSDIMFDGSAMPHDPFPFEWLGQNEGHSDFLFFKSRHIDKIKEVIKDDVFPADNFSECYDQN